MRRERLRRQREALLELTRVEIAYGGIHAVKGIDLHVDKGELVCLIGTNGAGKTTTLKGITGLQPVKDGAIKLRRRERDRSPRFRARAQGSRHGSRGPRRVRRAHHRGKPRDGRLHTERSGRDQEDIERVFALFPRLKERRRQTAGTLSGGEQQMLAMGRALMSKPKLLLLDEPSMGLAPLMVQKVFETVLKVSGEGVTILLIEQNAKLALEVSNRGYVMESGEITLSGDAKTLLHDPAVRAAYLGEGA